MFYYLAAEWQLLNFLQPVLKGHLIQSAAFLAEFLRHFKDVIEGLLINSEFHYIIKFKKKKRGGEPHSNVEKNKAAVLAGVSQTT